MTEGCVGDVDHTTASVDGCINPPPLLLGI